MAAADAIIFRDGPVAEPMEYVVPASAGMVPLNVSATFDGSSAAGTYQPALIILTPDGKELGPYPLQQIIAAGASARVSWFPGVAIVPEVVAAQPVGVGVETVYYDTPNANTPLTMATTLELGTQYVLVVEGTWSFWNEALSVGTPEADAQFPGATGGRVSTQVGVDAETWWSFPSDHVHPAGHQENLELSLDGGVTYAHVEPVDGPFAVAPTGHLYRYELTGEGFPLTVKLLDINAADNYGKIRLTLQVPSGTGSGSGAGSLVPPADATNSSQVLAVLNGLPVWTGVDGGSA